MAGKTGRNDKCPCGSGKKYKKCCYDKDLRANFEAENAEFEQEKRCQSRNHESIKT
jgi:hypothetical protein